MTLLDTPAAAHPVAIRESLDMARHCGPQPVQAGGIEDAATHTAVLLFLGHGCHSSYFVALAVQLPARLHRTSWLRSCQTAQTRCWRLSHTQDAGRGARVCQMNCLHTTCAASRSTPSGLTRN